MSVSELKLIKRCAEFCEMDQMKDIPPKTRGIYVLFKRRKKFNARTKKWKDKYDVVLSAWREGRRPGCTDGLTHIAD